MIILTHSKLQSHVIFYRKVNKVLIISLYNTLNVLYNILHN